MRDDTKQRQEANHGGFWFGFAALFYVAVRIPFRCTRDVPHIVYAAKWKHKFLSRVSLCLLFSLHLVRTLLVCFCWLCFFLLVFAVCIAAAIPTTTRNDNDSAYICLLRLEIKFKSSASQNETVLPFYSSFTCSAHSTHACGMNKKSRMNREINIYVNCIFPLSPRCYL